MIKLKLSFMILLTSTFLSGCSLSKQINPYDLPRHNTSMYETVGVKKKNGEYIKFKDGYLIEDSFAGETKKDKEIKIPITEIDHINLIEGSSGKTIAIVGGLFLLFAPIAIAIALDR